MNVAIDTTATEIEAFHRRMLQVLVDAGVPFMVGGGYALRHFTGITRPPKDLDVFVHPADCPAALAALAGAGCRTEMLFPHWLGKATAAEGYVDVIFSSGNGVAEVDDGWFDTAVDGCVMGLPVRVCPVEETIWSKAFVMERERYDGADVAHLLHACGRTLDWNRLLNRFGAHWRVLMSHLMLLDFIYPPPSTIPAWVMGRLIGRLRTEVAVGLSGEALCQGTLLSRPQYLDDLAAGGLGDARVAPHGRMSPAEAALWTEAIEEEPPEGDAES